MKASWPRDDAGMVLLNVLIIVALASAVAAVMISGREAITERTLRFSEASQALALARSGELSVASALRRDSQVAPASDHWREAWVKQVSQAETRIDGGRFALAVLDGQARFNLNTLASGDPGQEAIWRAIAQTAGLDAAMAERVRRLVVDRGRLDSLEAVKAAGLTDLAISRLAPWTATLPAAATSINLNTAPDGLLALVLAASPAQAQRLVETRRQAGFLTPADLQAAGASIPAEAGFTTQYVQVRTRVTIGETAQALDSLLLRKDGRVDVIQRRRTP